ncbi:Retrovirus-related Pol polyprotein from transposon TNT 1-94 [Vitis vinifera]|uniref:Retrovirus-related Pol polyprotein from transposon TNT 1-94 n=1 Tax=Vitis vinifera TaxID=29760 RepID=A0A438F755_VITVI|nr:Retrovirus-related Pol polyprotein from transposon TNT 1-94 [Vitis vinifera]
MKDEMDSLLGNQTWELTELPVGKKALHNKWVYRIKNEHDGSKRYKARLVVKGFQQKEALTTQRYFSPVVKMSQLDLYLEWWLQKTYILSKALSKQFAMKDLGAAKQILGMRIIRDKANGTLKFSQSEYVKKVLSRRRKGPYEQGALCSAIGSLMYAMVCTRPDIAHAVGVVSRFMSASLKLQGYVDADFAGDIDSRKKAEYVAATEAGKEMIWLHGFLDELDMLTKGVTIEKLKLCAASIGLLA